MTDAKDFLGLTVYPISKVKSSLPWIKLGNWTCFVPSGVEVVEIRRTKRRLTYIADNGGQFPARDVFLSLHEADAEATKRNIALTEKAHV